MTVDNDTGGISSRQTWHNSLRIMSASMIVQVVAMACTPVIARLYSPDDIGALGVILALVGIGTTVACLRYEQAIMVECDSRRSTALWHLSFILATAVSLIIGIATYIIGGEQIAVWLETPDIEPFVWLIAPLVFLSAVGYAMTFLFNSNNEFQLTARYTLTQGLSNNILKIALGSLSAAGLYVANVASHIAALAVSIRRLPRQFSKPRELYEMACKHWRFPAFNMPHALISTAAANLPILVFAKCYSPADVGCFALCLTFGYKPVNVFALSANQAFFHSSSRNHSVGQRIAPLLFRFLIRASLIIIPLWILLHAAMPWLVDLIFGDEWLAMTDIMRALLPLFVASLLSTSLSFVPLMFHRQAAAMTIELISAVMRTAALIVGANFFDITTATWIYTLTHAAFLAAQLVWYCSLIRRAEKA